LPGDSDRFASMIPVVWRLVFWNWLDNSGPPGAHNREVGCFYRRSKWLSQIQDACLGLNCACPKLRVDVL